MREVVQIVFTSGTQVLLGYRQGTEVLDQYWGFPSGRVENGELPYDAAVREAIEEVSVEPNELVLLAELLDPDRPVRNYIYLCMDWSGDFKNMEPKLCREIGWFSIRELPRNCTPLTYGILPKLKQVVGN